LAEIVDLLKREEVKGASLTGRGRALQLTGVFLHSVLKRLGIKPELAIWPSQVSLSLIA